jgi:hypothetical protein
VQARSNFALNPGRPGTEFFDAETGRQKSPPSAQTPPETKIQEVGGPEILAETLYLTSRRKRAVCKDCVVETIWTKLPTPHAEIEPVSETRAGNGIFCCRDRAANWAHSPELQEQRPR